MNVEKQNYVILPPNIIEYYKLKVNYAKTKNRCPLCHKHPLLFLEKNRVLSCECKTEGCKANMKFFIDKVITYDELYSITRDNYSDSTDTVLKEKFDIIFNYKNVSDITDLKDKYLSDKLKYDDLYADHYNKVEQKVTIIHDANEHKIEYIGALKKSLRDGNGVPPGIPKDLNAVLDTIHKAKYTTLSQETILTPQFDLGFTIL